MPGPLPKPNRRRRNADTFTGARRRNCPACGSLRDEDKPCPACGAAPLVLSGPAGNSAGTSGPRITAPELPTPRRWLKATRAWWEAWTRSVQVAHFQPSDWETLKALLPVVDGMHREDDPLKKAKLLETIHRLEKALGGTHMERLRARINDGGPAIPAGGPGGAVGHGPRGGAEDHGDEVAVLAEYRAMLSGESPPSADAPER